MGSNADHQIIMDVHWAVGNIGLDSLQQIERKTLKTLPVMILVNGVIFYSIKGYE
jgi:hypothetical protein